jgi:hypothetical protein
MESTNQLLPLRPLDAYVDLLPYVRRLGERWRLIAICVALVVLATGLFDLFLATRWYRSMAVLRPVAATAVEGRITGFVGGLGGGLTGLGGLAESLGGGGASDADEYIAILGGFGFSTALIEQHRLSPELLRSAPWYQGLMDYWSPADRRWQLYRLLQERFDCGYSRSTGNMSLAFTATSPAAAEKILGYYIDDLRDLLRAREINGASAAIDSLRAEALSTSDPVLRSELYGLEAKQLERKKMAQVEADFAFRVLDPPAAPDKKYRPKLPLDCALAGFLTALATAVLILLPFRRYRGESRGNVLLRPVGIASRKSDPAGGSG